MTNLLSMSCLAGALALVAACAPGQSEPSSPTPASASSSPSPDVLEAAARADSVRRHYTPADVEFMTGMIHHHAQALVMARMAPTHDASRPLQVLAARIINGQKDEIALMQRWLRERGEPVPEVDDDGRVAMSHHGDGAHPAMAGMLSAGQMARLDEARGEEWDRLFLTYMIQHHQGAVVMVERLFATPGAGQGDDIFKIAADIGADQASEIDRMQRMLQELVF